MKKLHWRHRGKKCRKCGEPFQDGDKIHTQPPGQSMPAKHYHQKCWEAMLA